MEAYFDNSATTKVMDAAAKLMLKVMKEDYGNPSARHRKGLEAEHYIKEARTNIARTLRVQEKEIFLSFSQNLLTIPSICAILTIEISPSAGTKNKRRRKYWVATNIPAVSVLPTQKQ